MAKSHKEISIMNDDRSIIGYDIALFDVVDLFESVRLSANDQHNLFQMRAFYAL